MAVDRTGWALLPGQVHGESPGETCMGTISTRLHVADLLVAYRFRNLGLEVFV